jgi:lysozyme
MATIDDHPRKFAVGASGLGAVAMAGAVALVGGFEGKRNWTYFDVVGVPTACYGHTGPDVKAGQHYTDAQCSGQLADDIRKHYDGMVRCAPRLDTVADAPKRAFVSLTFNIGVSGFCRSSIPRKVALGQDAAACATISLFDKAGGHVVKGLTIRRAAERRLCEEGLR